MEQRQNEIVNTANFTYGFTRIPHSIGDALLLFDLTGRERRVVDLIFRLTYGCLGKKWAKLNLADLQTIGITKGHARAVMDGLFRKQIILRNEKTKEYKLNEDYIASEVAKTVTPQLERLSRLVGKQLSNNGSSQIRNAEVTEIVTNRLPKEGLVGSQNGNLNELPKREHFASNDDSFSTPKDTLKINKYSDKDSIAVNNTSKDGFQIITPKGFQPNNEGEAAAYEAWNQLEHNNPLAFSTTYYVAYKKGLPSSLFYQFISEIKQDETIKNRGAIFNSKAKGYFEKKANKEVTS